MKHQKSTVITNDPADLIVKSSSWGGLEDGMNRDDISLSSTLTADGTPQKPLRLSAVTLETKEIASVLQEETSMAGNTADDEPQQVPRTPLVSFDESQNTYYDNETMCSEDCAQFWYSTDEYTKFKKTIIRTVKALLKHEGKSPPETPGLISNLLENTYQACFECSKETSKSLVSKPVQAAMKNQYRQNEEYLLGLERLIVRRIGKDRQELRKCLQDIIGDMQTQARANKVPAAVLAHNIAQVSQEATRSSRLFARHLGYSQVPYLLTQRPSIK